MRSLHPEDIFLRLPCAERMYEDQTDASTPFFQSYVAEPARYDGETGANLGTTARLVRLVAISDDVLVQLERAAHWAAISNESASTAFVEKVERRLGQWQAALPETMTCSRANLERSLQDRTLGTYVAMHTQYLTTLIMLYRCVRWTGLDSECLTEHIRRSQEHAGKLLDLMIDVARLHDHGSVTKNYQQTHFIDYGITLASDVVSARGLKKQIPDVLRWLQGGLHVLDKLPPCWRLARIRADRISERVAQLEQILTREERRHEGDVFKGDRLETFEYDRPLISTFSSISTSASAASPRRLSPHVVGPSPPSAGTSAHRRTQHAQVTLT